MSESLLRAAFALGGSGKYSEAAALYQKVLDRDPRNFHALHGLGVICFRSGKLVDAERLISGALSINPRAADALLSLGTVLMAAGKPVEALQQFEGALRIKPDYVEARGNRAALLLRLSRHAEALAECDQLLVTRRDVPQAWGLRAGALLGLNRPAEAVGSLDNALKLSPGAVPLWADRAFALVKLGRPREALSSLDRALQLEPRNPELALRRADLLAMLKQNAEAVVAYDLALALNPNDSDGWNRRGIALVEIGKRQEAFQSFSQAVARDPQNTEARNNRANILFELKRFAEAARDFQEILRRAPATPFVRGFLIQSRLRICDWRQLDRDRDELTRALAKGERVIDPQGYLSICTNPEDQLRCARIAIGEERRPGAPPRRPARAGHRKIRVAYLSADYRPHPVAFLIAGVFEHHDRKEFELTGVSLKHAGSSKIGERIANAFGEFIDGSKLTDEQIAAELTRREIDIAVDLTGFTEGSRPGILLQRPAPVQVNFLGYPGTMGSPHIDYIIADRFLIPESERQFYAENVVTMPHTYQANDARRDISDRIFTRREAGLPDEAFVFCCFNNNYKITPEIFAVWMRLLAKVAGSVLWLLQDSEDAAVNLRREAAARGVQPERLYFAPRIAPPEHLARQRVADLFLDTSPYSAHTTCSDALFVGLPVVSLYGATFPARVAVSLLNAIGMGELATLSLEQYESTALFLAQNPGELGRVKAKLIGQRATSPLFDTARFTRNLEQAYRQMADLSARGMAASALSVEGAG